MGYWDNNASTNSGGYDFALTVPISQFGGEAEDQRNSAYWNLPSAAQQAIFRRLGYSGEFGPSTEGMSPREKAEAMEGAQITPEFADWMTSNGYHPVNGGKGGTILYSYADNNGKLIDGPGSVDSSSSSFMDMAIPLMMAVSGPLGAAFGGGAMGGAAAGGVLGGVSGGMNAKDNGGSFLDGVGKGALAGAVAGGAGGAFGSGAGQYDLGGALDVGGSWGSAINKGAGTLLNSAVTGKNPTGGLLSAGLGGLFGGDQTAALPGNQVGAMNGGNMDGYDWGNVDLFGGGMPDLSGVNQDWLGNIDLTGGAFGGGMADLSGYWKPEQMDFSAGQSGLLGGIKNLVGSAAGAVGGDKNLAALVGAGLGAIGGNKGDSRTTQQQIDPRMAQYLYGTGPGDTNSLFGAAQKQWMDNKSGINPAMQAGLDMQLKTLQDPAYSKTYTDMRTQGQGLMNAPIAQNPFTGGPTAGTGLLPGGDRIQNLMAMGRGLLSA